MPWLIFPDTVDVVELKKGDRPSGSMGAVMTFCRTITTAVASASVGWVLAGANYIEHTADQIVTQPDSVATALRIFIGVMVGVLFVTAFIASCSYKVTDKKLSRIRYFSKIIRRNLLLTECLIRHVSTLRSTSTLLMRRSIVFSTQESVW